MFHKKGYHGRISFVEHGENTAYITEWKLANTIIRRNWKEAALLCGIC